MRRQHGEGSLYQRGRKGGRADGQWVAVADLGWRNGKRDRREFTADTQEEARAKRDRFLARRRDGFTLPKGRPPTTGEWMRHWLDVIARQKVEATTWESTYRQKVTELICPFFDRIPLPELNEEHVESWHSHLQGVISKRTGRPLSASTIGQAHRIMSRALKVAVARGRLPRNPCSNVTPPKVPRAEITPPSAAETRVIVRACENRPNGARWILAITTGLRQGEALALEWRDVRLSDPPSLTVRRAAARVNGERIVKQPKSASSRRNVTLPQVAVRALLQHRDGQTVRGLRDDLVFATQEGQPWHPRADWQDWRDLLAELSMPPYRVHDARHGYATMLLEQGVDPRVVQDQLGHSTSVLLQRYQHVREVMHLQVAAAIDRALSAE